MNNQEFIVYADFNCPFCFALHERLTSLGLMEHVDWRTIEHAPTIKYDINDYHMQSELTNEVATVRKLAPEVNIVVPPARPNSHLASELATELQNISPKKAMALRSLIYRALWIDGKDFGQSYVLDELLASAAIPNAPISLSTTEKLDQWQQEWEQGDFSRNIPALVASNGNKLLGLPSIQMLKALQLNKDFENEIDSDAVCQAMPADNILIATSNVSYRDELAKPLQDNYSVSFADNSREVFKACGPGYAPDLIIMDVNIKDTDGFTTCLILKERESTYKIPVVLVSRNNQTKQEIEAFASGASDFIVTPIDPQILKARVQILLRTKRTSDLLEQFARLDSLTELVNRREYERIIEKEWRRALRARNPLSLILLDIDHFKSYNKHYGILKGDECIVKVAQAIKNGMKRPSDIVARYSGEKFVAILPNTETQGALKLATDIQQQVEQLDLSHEYAPDSQRVTISQGIATIQPTSATQPTDLFDAADKALRKAKQTGRDNIVSHQV